MLFNKNFNFLIKNIRFKYSNLNINCIFALFWFARTYLGYFAK